MGRKQSELKRQYEERTATVYYHHFHRKYTHDQQLCEWMSELSECQCVYRWRAWILRAFFLINTDDDIKGLPVAFATKSESRGYFVRRQDL